MSEDKKCFTCRHWQDSKGMPGHCYVMVKVMSMSNKTLPPNIRLEPDVDVFERLGMADGCCDWTAR